MRKLIHTLKRHPDFIVILILGVLLRVKDIAVHEFWYDEAFTGLLMKVSNAELFRILHFDAHPPLYILLSRAWSIIFGATDISLRVLPLLFGVITLPVIYILTKNMFNKNAAVITTLLVAVNPFQIGYSVEARSYTFYGLLTLLVIYAIYRKRFNLFAAGICFLLATHYMSLTFIPFLILYYFWQAKKSKLSLIKAAIKLVPFIIFGVLIYNLGFLKTVPYQNIDWTEKSSYTSVTKAISAFSYGVKTKKPGAVELLDVNLPISTKTLGYTAFGMYFFWLAVYLKKYRDNWHETSNVLFSQILIFGPMLLLITFGIFTHKSVFVERYVFPSSLVFLMSSGFLLSKILRFEQAAIIVALYILTLTRLTTPSYYYGIKEMAKTAIAEKAEVVFVSPIDFTVAFYYFGLNPNIKFYDPKNPNANYQSWGFIDNKKSKPTELNTAIIVASQESQVDSNFKEVVPNVNFGNFRIYTYKKLPVN